MISVILILAIGLTALSLYKVKLLRAETSHLDEKIAVLEESVKNTPFLLKKKLARILLSQKLQDRESISTITFKKAAKSASILFPWDTIFTTAQDEGMGLTGTCEGNGDCGLCAFTVISGEENLSPLTPEEDALLKKLELPAGARLSCQSRAKGNIVIDFLQY